MLFTDNEDWAEKSRIIRSQGEDPNNKYTHPYLGHNYRMTDINAAIGLEQVKRFESILNKRKLLAEYYSEHLSQVEEIKIKTEKHSNSWFLYPILIDNRDFVYSSLKKQGITTNISWPLPIYKQKYYEKYYTDRCPNSELASNKVICLPMYLEMTLEEQDYVIKNLKDAIKLAKDQIS